MGYHSFRPLPRYYIKIWAIFYSNCIVMEVLTKRHSLDRIENDEK